MIIVEAKDMKYYNFEIVIEKGFTLTKPVCLRYDYR